MIQLDPAFNLAQELARQGEDAVGYDVAGVIAKHQRELGKCYRESKIKDSGTVVVEVTISPNGRTKAASVADNDFPDSSLGPCVASAILLWQFPASPDGDEIDLELPIVFGQTGKAKATAGKRGRRGLVDDITQIAPNHYLVMRSQALALLTDPALGTQAQFAPSPDGKDHGYVIKDIKPGSVYERLGFHDGDTLRKVNHVPFSMDSDPTRLIQAAQESAHLVIELTRDGAPVTLTVEIIPEDVSFPDLEELRGIPGMEDFHIPIPPVPPAPPVAPPSPTPKPPPTP